MICRYFMGFCIFDVKSFYMLNLNFQDSHSPEDES